MREEEFLASLNSQQRQAVKHIKGRLLILAGAGSGKTKVLTMRIAYLIRYHGVDPASILGLTFTNKAASEMRSRIEALIDKKDAKAVTLSTFHGFCLQILKREIHRLGYTHAFTLYHEKEVARLAEMIARDLLGGHEGSLPSVSTTLHTISLARNRGISPNEIQGTGSGWHDRFTQTLYKRLNDSLRAYNAVDFDSLQTLTVELLENFPDVLEHYQNKFQYLLIDEYQDTNPIQFKLASLLSTKSNNLCVVGDDDQSIYGWRGAEVKNILNFSNALVIKLEQNYRSNNVILKSANAVIKNNRERYEKALWSQRDAEHRIEIFHAPTDQQEAEAIVTRLVSLKQKVGLQWGDFAILYRSNALSRKFEIELTKQHWKDGNQWLRGIPFRVYGGMEFYERREIKDLMAYLRVIHNPLDQEALLRIMNYPRRGISDKTIGILTEYNRSRQIPLWQVLNQILQQEVEPTLLESLTPQALSGIRVFCDLIEKYKEVFLNKPLDHALQQLVEAIAFKKAIDEEVKSDKMRQFKWDNIQELILSLKDFEKAFEGERHSLLHDFLTTSTLNNDWNGGSQTKQLKSDHVHLMTFHSAKGLEFPACYLVGVEDHILPHEKSISEGGLEEERRLMYVAMTRAMHYLTLSMAQRRLRMGKETPTKPSRFLHEIPKELLHMTRWDTG